jgi:hypothetical protein
MAIELIDAHLIPPTAFVRRSRLLECKEWKEAVAALPTIKPQKAIRIALSERNAPAVEERCHRVQAAPHGAYQGCETEAGCGAAEGPGRHARALRVEPRGQVVGHEVRARTNR